MPRRKTPGNPETRRELARLAQETREKVREFRLALEYGLEHPRGDKTPEEMRAFANDAIGKLRDSYFQARVQIEFADGLTERYLERYIRRLKVLHGDGDGEPAAAARAGARGIPPKRRRAR